MTNVYNKLFTKILDSSIWLEQTPTRIVWVTLLAAMDQDGYAHFSAIGNLAARARVTDAEAQAAVDCFLSADPNSEDQEFEGRRIERIPGGFIVLNAKKYRELVTSAVNRERIRLRVQKSREKKPGNAQVLPVTQSEANTEAEPLKDTEANASVVKPAVSPRPPCPYEKIIELYHGILPELSRCREISAERKANIRARWNNGLGELDRWENYFTVVSKSDFLMGRNAASPGRSKPFVADIDFLIRKSTVIKIAEGKYHD